MLKERSSRLDGALAANTDLTERLSQAVRQNAATTKECAELRVEVEAAKAAAEEVAAGSAPKKTELALRQELEREQRSAQARVTSAVAEARGTTEGIPAAEETAQAATAERDGLAKELKAASEQTDRWRVLYEASLATDSPAASKEAVAEVRRC